MVLGFCLRTLKEEHLLAAKVIWVCNERKKYISSSFCGLYSKRRGQLICMTKEAVPQLQILRIILILEEKQVHRLLLVQGLNAHNWMHTMDLRENGTVELLSPVYIKNFCFSNSPGTMAQPPLTRFSPVGRDILMPGIFILGNLW